MQVVGRERLRLPDGCPAAFKVSLGCLMSPSCLAALALFDAVGGS